MHFSSESLQGTDKLLAAFAAALALLGLLRIDVADQLFVYLLLAGSAILPAVLWARMNVRGVPVFPVLAVAHIPYFALPMLSSNENLIAYDSADIARAGLTVVLYLLTATAAWTIAASVARAQAVRSAPSPDRSNLMQLIWLGLWVGLLFHVGAVTGALSWMGSYFGLVRSLAITLMSVSCFLLGVHRGMDELRDSAWWGAVAVLAATVAVCWSSLFLVGGVIYLLASMLGYVIASRRIPWAVAAVALSTVVVLHAGKAQMREKYWLQDANFGGVTSVLQVPALGAEWIAAGLGAIATGESTETALDRASLLQMVMRVQRDTPDYIDFLYGETYAFLPSVLLPRFIDPEKPASQVGMNLLNVHYGLLTADETAITAIGWGLIAEAYANFGYIGVIAMALVVGLCCGALAAWCDGAPPISLPTLISIAALIVLMNLEADFTGLTLSLLQSMVSVVIFMSIYNAVARHQAKRALVADAG